ncbi:MAG: hypothetical protein ACTSUE_17610 [Promethearchaeota archaeon]
MSEKAEMTKDGIKIRKEVQLKTEMVEQQQESLVKTVKRYEQRDNPLEQFFENAVASTVTAFLKLNEQVVSAIPDETRLKIQATWQKFLLAF